jgi:hypothetical protein
MQRAGLIDEHEELVCAGTEEWLALLMEEDTMVDTDARRALGRRQLRGALSEMLHATFVSRERSCSPRFAGVFHTAPFSHSRPDSFVWPSSLPA